MAFQEGRRGKEHVVAGGNGALLGGEDGAVGIAVGTTLGSLATWYLVAKGIDLRAFLPESLEFGGVVFDPILRAAWDWPWMARIAGYVAVLALVASLYPAAKAVRVVPAEVMRAR